jgi:hypothetical protein
MEYYYTNLILEVTRRCNMTCEHCLRGCKENVDMSKETVDTLLDSTEGIGSLTFTGGEPILNAKLIIYIIDEIMSRSIDVNSFYLVTNAGVFNKELFFKLIEFYHYVEEKEYSFVSVSFDNYHKGADEKYIQWWESLSFYANDKDQRENFGFNNSLISEGYALEYGIGNRGLNLSDEMEVEYLNYFSGDFYVNAKGEITNNCDMSYETQEEHIQGTVDNIDVIFNKHNKSQEAA